MGIDKMSIAANYHNQAVQATQINKVNVQTSSDTAAKEMTADSKVSTASTVQITNTQKSRVQDNLLFPTLHYQQHCLIHFHYT